MIVNHNLIREKFAGSKKYLEKLDTIIENPQEVFVQDFDLQLHAERVFQVISQIMLDVCTHIIAQSNETPPATYADCIEKLGTLKVIGTETVSSVSSLVKMRNLIVHQYQRIKYPILFEGLRELKKDFLRFQDEILKWLNDLTEKEGRKRSIAEEDKG